MEYSCVRKMDLRMDQIEIKRNGDTVSRVVFAPAVSGFAGIIRTLGRVFMVYDEAVERYAVEVKGHCPNVAGNFVLHNVSEESKTVRTADNICRWLLETGADRNSSVLAVGGGIVSDMAGFAASIYKRGIRASYLPTTLLDQVDAAIGGKTGVNLDSYKNIIGTFHQPEYTFVCPEVLESLPDRVFADGLAEMLKTFIIDNGIHGDRVERMMTAVSMQARCRMETEFSALVAEAASVKAGVVTRDELEGGERRKLNLGHTFAHALESMAGYRISHGEAVAWGLLRAIEASYITNLCNKDLYDLAYAILKEYGYDVDYRVGRGDWIAYFEALKKDKKKTNGSVKFVLLESLGKPCLLPLEEKYIRAVTLESAKIRF